MPRSLTLLILGLAAVPVLPAQIRLLRPKVATIAPVTTTTLSALGGMAVLGNGTVSASVDHVNILPAGIVGGPGEVTMTAAIPGAGVPASRLTIRAATAPAGNYSIAVTFAHGKAGSVQISPSGAAPTLCTLMAAGWNDTQTCSASFPVSGVVDVSVQVTAGTQVFPVQIALSH